MWTARPEKGSYEEREREGGEGREFGNFRPMQEMTILQGSRTWKLTWESWKSSFRGNLELLLKPQSTAQKRSKAERMTYARYLDTQCPLAMIIIQGVEYMYKTICHIEDQDYCSLMKFI